jgi:hypothetical protein
MAVTLAPAPVPTGAGVMFGKRRDVRRDRSQADEELIKPEFLGDEPLLERV